MAGKKFYCFTIGCKINQYETQALAEHLLSLGMEETRQVLEADLILINSCAVTRKAVQDLRKTSRRFFKKNVQALVVVTGCAVTGRLNEELESLPPGIHILRSKDFVSLDRLLVAGGLAVRTSGQARGRVLDDPWQLKISAFPRARPVIKIQDGCSRFCSYCIVPYTRGRPVSRPVDEILAEARALAANGFQELIISGINLGQFAWPQRVGYDFWDLLRDLDNHLAEHFGEQVRLRLSSLEPTLLNDKGLETLEQCNLVCPHLHLSLQSASPGILRQMGRSPEGPELIASFLSQLKDIWVRFALGADVLLGFPGETEADFSKTKNFISEQAFTYGHVFSYSPRPGTKASGMAGQVPGPVKRERSAQLRGLLKRKKAAFIAGLLTVGSQDIVLEEVDPALGLNQYYVVCHLQGRLSGLKKGQRIDVQAKYVAGEGLMCVLKPGGIKVEQTARAVAS